MKLSFNIFLIIFMFLTNSDVLLSMHTKMLTLAQPTITITNDGTIPFVAKTDLWSCVVPAHITSPAQACTNETFLEILVGTKIGRYLIKDALGLLDNCPPAKKLTIIIFKYPESEDISAILNDTFAISLEDAPPTPATPSRNNSLYNESDTTETTDPISIDSPIVQPKARLEDYQGADLTGSNAN